MSEDEAGMDTGKRKAQCRLEDSASGECSTRNRRGRGRGADKEANFGKDSPGGWNSFF